MSTFDDLMQEARDAGVDPTWVDRVQAATAASPLRQERDTLKADLQKVTEDAQRYRTATLNGQFQQLGITVKPDALNIPTDLDPLDGDKVREWAVGMGLAQPAPPAVPADEQAAHQQLADASAGAGAPPRNDARAEILAAESASDFWARANAAGVTTTQ